MNGGISSMFEWICLFFPAALSLALLLRVDLKKRSPLDLFLTFCILVLCINGLDLVVMCLLFGYRAAPVQFAGVPGVFLLKYLAISCLWALLLPYGWRYYRTQLQGKLRIRLSITPAGKEDVPPDEDE